MFLTFIGFYGIISSYMTNEKNVRIGKAAKILGVSIQTLRNWEKSGKLRSERSVGKQRFYTLQYLNNFELIYSLVIAF